MLHLEKPFGALDISSNYSFFSSLEFKVLVHAPKISGLDLPLYPGGPWHFLKVLVGIPVLVIVLVVTL